MNQPNRRLHVMLSGGQVLEHAVNWFLFLDDKKNKTKQTYKVLNVSFLWQNCKNNDCCQTGFHLLYMPNKYLHDCTSVHTFWGNSTYKRQIIFHPKIIHYSKPHFHTLLQTGLTNFCGMQKKVFWRIFLCPYNKHFCGPKLTFIVSTEGKSNAGLERHEGE